MNQIQIAGTVTGKPTRISKSPRVVEVEITGPDIDEPIIVRSTGHIASLVSDKVTPLCWIMATGRLATGLDADGTARTIIEAEEIYFSILAGWHRTTPTWARNIGPVDMDEDTLEEVDALTPTAWWRRLASVR